MGYALKEIWYSLIPTQAHKARNSLIRPDITMMLMEVVMLDIVRYP